MMQDEIPILLYLLSAINLMYMSVDCGGKLDQRKPTRIMLNKGYEDFNPEPSSCENTLFSSYQCAKYQTGSTESFALT